MNTPPTILVADDHASIRSGIRSIIHEAELGTIIAMADRGDQALQLVRELDPDIALVDQRMPGMSGIEIAAAVLGAGLRTRVVIVSSHNSPPLVRAAISAGAAGYIVKDSDIDSFGYVIRTVLGGQQAIDPQLVPALVGDSTLDLSPRDVKVLERIAKGQMNDGIAADLNLSPETVMSHVSSIIRQLGVTSRMDGAVGAGDYRPKRASR